MAMRTLPSASSALLLLFTSSSSHPRARPSCRSHLCVAELGLCSDVGLDAIAPREAARQPFALLKNISNMSICDFMLAQRTSFIVANRDLRDFQFDAPRRWESKA